MLLTQIIGNLLAVVLVVNIWDSAVGQAVIDVDDNATSRQEQRKVFFAKHRSTA